MADTGIFATTAEVQRKAGDGANATSNVEAYINDFITQAESFINVLTGKNWSDSYSTLNVDVKGILKEAASNLAAIYVLSYGTASITIENRINILWQRFIQCIKLLRDQDSVKFIT